MMRKSWFYRLLFSYLPVFFILISFLIAVFFISMGDVTREAAETVNRGSAEHTLELVDHSLRTIEYMMIRDMMSQDDIKNFFNDILWDEPYQNMVLPSQKLRESVSQSPLIHSMYLVRWEDAMVIGDKATIPLSQFEDRDFIQGYQADGMGSSWTALRPYRELMIQNTTDVITLVKPYPLPAGDQGIMVVNVGIRELKDLVEDLFDTGFIYVVLVDRNDNLLFRTDQEPLPFNQTMTEVQSSYSGWKFKSQIQGGVFYQFASNFNKLLLLSGIVAIIVAVFYITYISKRNYRPLASLTKRVHEYSVTKAEQLLKTGGKDEFSFLENALDQMIEQSDELLTEQEEHLHIRKRQWIKETLEGDYNTVAKQAWSSVSERFGWSQARERAAVVVIEIDQYIEFCEVYTKRDQSLLKYLLGNVVQEIAQKHGLLLFGEWLQTNMWCAFLQLGEEDTDGDTVLMFTQQVVGWIQNNLDFRVTVGLGDIVSSVEDISSSYEQALYVLQYKMTLGNNRVITHWEVPDPTTGTGRRMVIDIQDLTQSFKLGKPDWEGHYDRFINELRIGMSTKDEILHQVNYLVYQLSRELQELNPDYQGVWFKEAVPLLNQLIKKFDTFEELNDGLRGILQGAQNQMASLREERTYSSTMKEVRQYIADNYGNPDLSLDHLSTTFDLNSKYVSHLFKEEFGEKFVEYLANVRMEKAKELLCSTSLSIQDIALRVGYTLSFSFIRVFKKSVGMTPGDYRKQAKH